MATERNFGRGDLMALAAVRYCLGRQSYIVGDCVDWLIDQWPNIGKQCQAVILRDINEAFERDDAARADDRGRSLGFALGMDMDRRDWERARKALKEGRTDA